MKIRHRKKEKKNKFKRKECKCDKYFYYIKKVPKNDDKNFYYYEYNNLIYAKCKYCGCKF